MVGWTLYFRNRKRPLISTGNPDIAGWKQPLAVFWTVSLLSYLSANFLSPILPFFLGTLGLDDPAQVNLWTSRLSTAILLPSILSVPFWGMVGDRFGHRKMVMRAMTGAGICLFLTGFVTNLHQLLAIRIAHGLFGGFGIACMAYLSRITPKERTGQVFGLLQSAAFTAVTLGPACGGFLADRFGFRNLYILTGVIHLFAALTVFLLVRPDRPDPGHKPPITFLRPLSIIWHSPVIRRLTFLRLFIDAPSALLYPLLPVFIAGVLGQSDLSRIGIVFSAAGGGTVLGALILGRLGDKVGHRPLFLACILVCGLLFIPHALVREYHHLLVIRFLAGFFGAGIIPTLSAMVIHHVEMKDRGVTLAMISSLCGLGSAASVYFGGAIVNRIGFGALFLSLAGIFMLVALVGRALLKKERGTGTATDGRQQSAIAV